MLKFFIESKKHSQLLTNCIETLQVSNINSNFQAYVLFIVFAKNTNYFVLFISEEFVRLHSNFCIIFSSFLVVNLNYSTSRAPWLLEFLPTV